MNPIERIIYGYAHIGRVGYGLGAEIFKSITTHGDNKRLKKQHDDALDLNIQKDIPYISDKNRYHLLDVYEPKEYTGELKTIFQIHGGGLLYGTKELNRYSNMQLTRYGYRLIAISYPLCPKVSFYDQIHDCYQALKFCLKKYHFKEVYFLGDSAGALLCFTLASILKEETYQNLFHLSPLEVNLKAQALVSPMVVVDRHDMLACPGKNALKKKQKDWPCYPYLCDPRKMLNPSTMIPTLMTTSKEDMIREDVLSLNAIYEKENIAHEFYDFDPTERKLEHVFPITYPLYPESQHVFQAIDSFFRKY